MYIHTFVYIETRCLQRRVVSFLRQSSKGGYTHIYDMYVYIYTCVHASAYVYVYVYMHIYMRMYKYAPKVCIRALATSGARSTG